jgi:hypothetical protein
LGEYIEGEKKIQEQLQLTNYDLVLSKNILNFSTPPPVIRKAIEVGQPDRFLIADLYRFKAELESLSDSGLMIEARDLLGFLITLQRYRMMSRTLPKTWKNLSAADFEHLIANFDTKAQGKVPMNHFFTYVCLQNTPLPDAETLQDYEAKLEELSSQGRISLEDFLEVPTFFDQTQDQRKVYERSNTFDRVRHLKKLLFEVNGDLNKVKSLNSRTR